MNKKLIKTIKEIRLDGDRVISIKGRCKASDLQKAKSIVTNVASSDWLEFVGINKRLF